MSDEKDKCCFIENKIFHFHMGYIFINLFMRKFRLL